MAEPSPVSTLDLLTQRPTNSAPAEPVSPGTQVTDPMVLKALNDPANKSISQDPEEQKNFLRQGFEFLRDKATPVVAKASQYSPIDAGQALLSRATSGAVPAPNPNPVVSDEAAERGAKLVVPQTPGQAASYAAGLIPGAGLVPALIRVGAAAGLGAGANAATGYDPTMGAIEGGGGRLIGEGGAGLLNRYTAGKALTRANALDNVAVPKAIGSEVEAFSGVKTPADVKRLALGSGYTKLGEWFGKGQTQIEKALPGATVNSPALTQFKTLETGAASGAAPPAAGAGGVPAQAQALYNQASPATQAAMQAANPTLNFTAPTAAPSTGMPLSEAFDLVKRLGASAHQGDKTALGFQMRSMYRQAQEDLTRAIAQQDPALATLYGKMRDQYSTGMTILHAIKGDADKIFKVEGNRVIFNPTMAEEGGTPLQNAISQSLSEFKNFEKSQTVKATYRNGEIGGGDARLRDFLNTMWIRQHGGSIVPGASIHTGIPGAPAIVGRQSIQPYQMSPGTGGILGQTGANAASNLLDLDSAR